MGKPPGRTGFIGVRKDIHPFTGKIKYRAFIRHGTDQAQRSVGTFDTPEAAAKQYDCVAVALHGSQAKLNFPAANFTEAEIEAAHTVLQQRNMKTSDYKGVTARSGRWQAKAHWQYRHISLGTYDNEICAAEQYYLAQIQPYGGTVAAVPPHRITLTGQTTHMTKSSHCCSG